MNFVENKKAECPLQDTQILYGLALWSECNYRISENTDISTVCWQSARGIYSKLNGQAQ